MTEFLQKTALPELSRSEFVMFVEAIAKVQTADDAELDRWVRHFDSIVPHPAKRDLIFWPEEGADDTPEGIAKAVEQYCEDNGLPGFSDSGF